MGRMATQMLVLRRDADGYFRTSWYDEKNRRHFRSFGKNRTTATNRFSKFHAEWRRDRAVRNPDDNAEKTVRACWALFKAHADAYYVRTDGSATGEAQNFSDAMRELLSLFGELRVNRFDVGCLKAVRVEMVKAKLAVNTINARIRKIRQVFRWLAREQIIDPSVWHSLQSIGSLPSNRPVEIAPGSFVMPETTESVQPVPEANIHAVCQAVPAVVGWMIMVQWLTGMRPGELCRMRGCDIDRSSSVWLYQPSFHKTMHHGKKRRILIGPKAQAYIAPLLSLKLDDAIFKTPEGLAYDRHSYTRAIARACKSLGIDRWSPNQLRHNAATALRREFGLEVAQAVLGHSKADITEIYAQLDTAKAVRAMESVG